MVIHLSESVTFLVSMTLFFVFLIVSGYEISSYAALIPLIYLLQQVFFFGFSLLVATLTVFIRDLREVMGIVLQVWFWFTPIVYVRDILPDFVQHVMVFNPAYVVIESYQRIIVFGQEPCIPRLALFAAAGLGLFLFSYYVFRVLEKDVRDFV
jgi:lipopolysaccharide transport system permease protein